MNPCSDMFWEVKILKSKIIQAAHFWLDQNHRFFNSKIDCFFGVIFHSQKMINFANKRSVVLIQSKKGCLNDFGFQYFALPKHFWTWVHINLARFAPDAPVPIRAISVMYMNKITITQNNNSIQKNVTTKEFSRGFLALDKFCPHIFKIYFCGS